MDRRNFLKTSLAASAIMAVGHWQTALARGTKHTDAGRPWKGWRRGQLQVHFIYTGVAESMFFILPDGTTMLLDCGDHNAIGRGKLAVPVLPDSTRHAGEWIARYVERVNPHKRHVDYMLLSHYHSDHSGCDVFNAGVEERDGKPYALSGFSQAAETLHFTKAFDRAWPDYKDPIPLTDDEEKTVAHMKQFYSYQQKHSGLKIEKFRVGQTDQIKMLHRPEKYPSFHIRNLCGNGRIAREDGTLRDLYEEYIATNHPKRLNENGMSLGFVLTYGRFRFYTAGDFSDDFKMPDGRRHYIEDDIADVCGRAQVAKINHHGHYSMTPKLISALRSRVYISCVWDQLHNVPEVLERLNDQQLYAGERLVCPTCYPKERQQQDAGKPWQNVVCKDSYEGSHIVLTVEEGGDHYSLTYIPAADESMIVKSVLNFES